MLFFTHLKIYFPLTYNKITDAVVFKSTIWLLVFYLFYQFLGLSPFISVFFELIIFYASILYSLLCLRALIHPCFILVVVLGFIVLISFAYYNLMSWHYAILCIIQEPYNNILPCPSHVLCYCCHIFKFEYIRSGMIHWYSNFKQLMIF